MSKRAKRKIEIIVVGEAAAITLAVGMIHTGNLILIVMGINLAFIGAVLLVLDHEARGRGE